MALDNIDLYFAPFYGSAAPFPEMDLNGNGEFDFTDLNAASSYYPVVRDYYYSPFGEIWKGEVECDTNPFRYAGEYYDKETGSIYLRARYYDPSNGRFLSIDPIKDGTNWYVYCGNNPIAFVDPSGLIVTQWDHNHCSPSEIEQLKRNGFLWSNGSEEERINAAMDSRSIRKQYLDANEKLLDNGYVMQTVSNTVRGSIPDGGVTATVTMEYNRLYTEQNIYLQLTNVTVAVDKNSGYAIKNSYVSSGQTDIYDNQSYNEENLYYGTYTYKPNWGMVIDDKGVITKVGVHVEIYAQRGRTGKMHNLRIQNQVYESSITSDGYMRYVENPDAFEIFEELLQGGRGEYYDSKKSKKK